MDRSLCSLAAIDKTIDPEFIFSTIKKTQGINSTDQQSRNLFLGIVHLLFGVAALMAAHFYLERNMGDAGWRIFCMINRETPCPSHGRWILMFNQILPVLAIKAGLKLKTILILHSISPLIIFYFFFLYNHFRLKDRISATAIVIASVFTVGKIYFKWSDLEMYLMVPFLITFASLLFSRRNVRLDRIVFFPLFIYLIIGSHPLSILPLIFILFWYALQRKKINGYAVLLIVGISLLIYNQSDSYERNMIGNLGDMIQNLIPNMAYITHHLWLILVNNIILWLMLLASLMSLFRNDKKLPAAVLAVFCLLYLIIIIGFAPAAHHKPYLIPLMPVILIIAFYQAGQEFFEKRQATWLMAAFFLLCILQTLSFRNIAGEKSALLKRIVATTSVMEGSKFLAYNDNLFQFAPIAHVDILYAETMITSALQGPQFAKSVVPDSTLREAVQKMGEYYREAELEQIFPYGIHDIQDSILPLYADIFYKEDYSRTDFKMWFSDALNDRYFQPGDHGFEWLHSNQTNDNLDVSSNLQIRLDFQKPIRKVRKNKSVSIPVVIRNSGEQIVYAGVQNHIQIATHWIHPNDLERKASTYHNLEFDLGHSLHQPLKIISPMETGNYILRVDLVFNGRELNAGEELTLQVVRR